MDEISISGAPAPQTLDRPFTSQFTAYKAAKSPTKKSMSPTAAHAISTASEAQKELSPSKKSPCYGNDFLLGDIAVFHSPSARPTFAPPSDNGFFSLTEVSTGESKAPPPPLHPAPTLSSPERKPLFESIPRLTPSPKPQVIYSPSAPSKLPPVTSPVNVNSHNPFSSTKKLPPRMPSLPPSPTKAMAVRSPTPSIPDLLASASPSRGNLLTPSLPNRPLSSLLIQAQKPPSTINIMKIETAATEEDHPQRHSDHEHDHEASPGEEEEEEEETVIHELEQSLKFEREAREKDRAQLMQLQSKQQELIHMLSSQGLIPAMLPTPGSAGSPSHWQRPFTGASNMSPPYSSAGPMSPYYYYAPVYTPNTEMMAQKLVDAERELTMLRSTLTNLHGKMGGTVINRSANPLVEAGASTVVEFTARPKDTKGPSFRTKHVFDHKGNVIIQ